MNENIYQSTKVKVLTNTYLDFLRCLNKARFLLPIIVRFLYYSGRVTMYIPMFTNFLSTLYIAEVFYYVNYVKVNYLVKNSTVDCKYLLYFL